MSGLARRMNMLMTTATSSSILPFTTSNPTYIQTSDPWITQWHHARDLTILFASTLAFFTLTYIARTLFSYRTAFACTPLHRPAALLRYTTYRHPNSHLPSLGSCILILILALPPLIATFAITPYYRPIRADGSPPLALRSGLFAVALTPFVYTLSFKANAITWLTGVSHEKLNVLHRWGGRLLLLLGVVHTVPFLVQPAREGGFVELKWWWREDWMNVTGCLALGALVWLGVGSCRVVRRSCYEFFVYAHMIAAVAFLAFMFWHCEDLLTSWSYLWATAGIWIGSLILRFAQLNWFAPLPAALLLLPGNAVKVSVATTLEWSPGQHVFVRFPRLGLWDNHPFSICSVPAQGGGESTLEMVVRPYKGFTRRLWGLVKMDPDAGTGVVLDGPYGGVPRAVEGFNMVVLIAGGSGVTAVVGFLLFLAARMRERDAGVRTEKIKLVWVVKDKACLGWFQQEIRDAVEGLPEGVVECLFYVTGELGRLTDSDGAMGGVGVVATKQSSDAEGVVEVEGIMRGRPDCGAMLDEWFPAMGERACVIVSGPTGLRNNVANSVAGLQKRVGGEGAVREIYLHTEAFGW